MSTKLNPRVVHNRQRSEKVTAGMAHKSGTLHLPRTSGYEPRGKKPPHTANPGFQVKQFPPTEKDAVRQHQKMSTGGHGDAPIEGIGKIGRPK